MKSWTFGLMVVASTFPTAEAMALYDPKLCFLLDGFLVVYGLIITGMFIKEKFFRTKGKLVEDALYTDLKGSDGGGGYQPLVRDAERGRNRWTHDESPYSDLSKRTDGDYKELPIKRERQKKNEQVYQGLSSATRDTYDSLQMQPLPAR